MTETAETRILRTELAKSFAKEIMRSPVLCPAARSEASERGETLGAVVADGAVHLADELMTRLGYGEGEEKA